MRYIGKHDGSGTDDTALGRGGMLYVVPGMLMCLITVIMLLCDLLLPDMGARQYMLYPILYRIQMLLAAACCLVCITRGGADLGRPDLTTMLFTGFAVCMIISTVINGFDRSIMFGVPYRYIGMFDLMIFMAVYMYCGSRIDGAAGAAAILLGIVLTADLIGLGVIFDSLIRQVEAFRGKEGLGAIFFHSNHFGYFFVMAVIIAAGLFIYGSTRQMTIALPSMLLDLCMLAVNRSLGCLIAASSVLFVMTLVALIRRNEGLKRAWVLAGLFSAGVAAALIVSGQLRTELVYTMREAVDILKGNGSPVMGHGRWELWQLTAGYISERPLFGYGCEGINEMLYEDTAGGVNPVSNAHCEPLTYAAFYGIPAALLYTAGCISAMIKGLRAVKRDAASGSMDACICIAAYAAAGYFISSLFGVEMFYTAPFFFILLGIACNGRYEQTEL